MYKLPMKMQWKRFVEDKQIEIKTNGNFHYYTVFRLFLFSDFEKIACIFLDNIFFSIYLSNVMQCGHLYV